MKKFNIAGPVKESKHYLIPPLDRWNLADILEYIEDEKYFILYAPRQSGKTSGLLALQKYLNDRDDYYAIYTNVECGQSARNDVRRGIFAIIDHLKRRTVQVIGKQDELNKIQADIASKNLPDVALNEFLQELSQISEKPVVIFFDEIDSLIGDTLIAVLRQLRAGYDMRPESFPQSIILCGVVDIRDYKIHRSDNDIITGGSCFNIKADALKIENFTKEQIFHLYSQHTKTTGQAFKDEIYDLAWEYTAGQPWLVNALAYEVCFKIMKNDDHSIITPEHFEQAKERLILSKATHLDQLADKLNENRVRRVIEPMFIGGNSLAAPADKEYCKDLGLIRNTERGFIISNAIYKEVLPRELTSSVQDNFLSVFQPEWINENQCLNCDKLMTMFQQFWRENSEIWSASIAGYHEAAPHLVFHAFLQRVGNANGIIEREYGLHRKRADIYLRWKYPTGQQRIVFELKMRTERETSHEQFKKLKADGLKQTAEYADICGASEAHLIIFDRRKDILWDEKVFTEKSEYNTKIISVWGM
jgi:hypothetical protein